MNGKEDRDLIIEVKTMVRAQGHDMQEFKADLKDFRKEMTISDKAQWRKIDQHEGSIKRFDWFFRALVICLIGFVFWFIQQ